MDILRSLVVFSVSNKTDQTKAHLDLDENKTGYLSGQEKDFRLCDVCMKIFALNSDKDIDEILLKSKFAHVLKKTFSANFQNVKCKCIHSRFACSEMCYELCSDDVNSDFGKIFPESISSINRLSEIVQKCKKDQSLLMSFADCDQCSASAIKDPFYESDFCKSIHSVTANVRFGKKTFSGKGTNTSKRKAKELAAKACVKDMMKGFNVFNDVLKCSSTTN